MRKTLYTLFAVLGLCLIAGCSDDNENNSPLAKQLAGEWHMASWNGAAPVDFDAYMSFTSGGSFEIYQQLDEPGYQKYSGSYKLNDATLTGKYSDNSPLAGGFYEISFDEAGNTLTMVSDPSAGEVSVYIRKAIPESIRNEAKVAKSSRSANRLLF